MAEEFTKPGTGNVNPADLARLRPLLEHYRKNPHPFGACKRDQMKHGLSEEHANRRCAVIKDLIVGNTKWRGKGKVTKSSPAWTSERVEAIDRIAKAFDSEAHPRWPKGTPGIGGQFCPKFLPEKQFNVATNVFRSLDPKNPRTAVLARRFNEAAKKEDWSKLTPHQADVRMKAILRNSVVAHLRTDDPLEAGRSVPLEQKGKPNPGTKKNPIDCGADIEKAALYLSLGKHVKLDQPDEVSTLIDKLGEYVNRTVAAGGDVPNLDLCKVSVAGTNIFCVKSKGIPRIKMPQLTGKPTKGSKADRLLKPDPIRGETDLTPEFLKFLKKVEKVKVEHENVRADHLRASQSQLNAKTVALLKSVLDRGEALTPDLPIVVSRDNYIVDGHHRWAAKVANDLNDNHPGDIKMDVFKIDMSITELLFLANSFAADWGIPQRSVAQNVTKHVLAAVQGETVEKFNPLELRDWRGRWAKAGALAGIAASGAALTELAVHGGDPHSPHGGDEPVGFLPNHPDFWGHSALQPTETVAKPHAVQRDAKLPHLEQRGDKLVYVVPYGTKVGAVKKAFLRAVHGRDLVFKTFDPNQVRDMKGRWALVHGTTIDAARGIEAGGVQPEIGDFVRDAYESEYKNAGYASLEDAGAEPVAYFTDMTDPARAVNAMHEHVAQKLGKKWGDVTQKDIEQNGALAFVSQKDADRSRVQYLDEADEGYKEVPIGVEAGDYYSTDSVPVSKVMTGKEMMDFLALTPGILTPGKYGDAMIAKRRTRWLVALGVLRDGSVEKYDPTQARGPDGRWIKGFASTFYKPETFAEHYWTGRLTHEQMVERDKLDRMTADDFNLPDKIKIDSDIKKKVKDAKSAEHFFELELGIPADGFADFQDAIAIDAITGENVPADAEKILTARFFQEIAQATRDAQKKFPILKEKGNGLGGIVSSTEESRRTGQRVPGGDEEGYWAMTGPEWGSFTGDEDWAEKKRIAMTKPTIKINVKADGFYLDEDDAARARLIALTDMTPYGRLTHEIGHAVAFTSGMEFYDVGESGGMNENLTTLIGLFRQVFTAQELADISQYGAGDAGEMLAELFSVLHTPGGMDTLNSTQKKKVLKFKRLINKFAKEHPDQVKGPIL